MFPERKERSAIEEELHAMLLAGGINPVALAAAAAAGVLTAGAYVLAARARRSLRWQMRRMGLRESPCCPGHLYYEGVYRTCFVGIEPDEDGGLRVSISHPDQDRVLAAPRLRDERISRIEVGENVATFRIPCASVKRPGVDIKLLVDAVIESF